MIEGLMKMYRMLILDDEPFIVDGLVDLFSKQQIGLEIYGAYTVTEALEYVQQTKIDLVISDMKMPRKSGLQFVDELLTFWPQCRIIFLSGYDEFDYIYEAMKRNVDGYILKTEDDQVLIDTVQQSIQKIEEKKLHEDELSQIETQMEKMIPTLKREFLRDLANEEDLEKLLHDMTIGKDYFQIDLTKKWLVTTGEVRGLSQRRSKRLREQYYLNHLAEKQLHPHLSLEFFISRQDLLVWLIQSKGKEGVFFTKQKVQWKAIHKYLKGFIEELQSLAKQTIKKNISFVLDPQPVNHKTFGNALNRMVNSLKIISYYKDEEIIIDLAKESPLFGESLSIKERPFWRRDLSQLEKKMMQGKLLEAKKIAGHLFQELFSHTYSNLQKTEFLYSLTLLLLKFLRSEDLRRYFTDKNAKKLDRLLETFPVMIPSREEVLEIIEEICRYQEEKREEGATTSKPLSINILRRIYLGIFH